MYYVVESSNSDFLFGELLNYKKKNSGIEIKYQNGDEFFLIKGKTYSHNEVITLVNEEGRFTANLREFPGYYSDEELMNYMSNNRICNSYFIQNGELPTQTEGWKIHISSSSFEDYMYKLSVLLPELAHCGLCYKILRPSMWGKFSELQNGKFITIYLTKIPKFSKKILNLIFAENYTFPVIGEKREGSCYFRYGAYKGKVVYNPYLNIYETDKRGSYKPDFIKDENWKELFYSVI